MSTILNTNGDNIQVPEPIRGTDFRCAVMTAKWNPEITHSLRDAAIDVLVKTGVPVENILSEEVSGTVELVNAAASCMRYRNDLDAIIVIGCVIKGDTPHFDYVCKIAADGVAALNARGEVPVVFGVLTVDNLQQAIDRAGGIYGNKGAEAAVAAIEMSNLREKLRAKR